MRSRDAALDAVYNHITRAVTGQDRTGVLTEEAVRDAEELAALTDPAADLDAAHALGTFHWLRYLALPDGTGQDDLDAATRLLAPVFRDDPEAVPVPMRRLYQQTHGHSGDTGPDPGALSDRAIDLATVYQSTGELPLLSEAVGLLRAAVAATPAGHRDRPMILSNLLITLRVLFERTGDSPMLAEAVQAGRDAIAATPAGHADRAGRLSRLGAALRVLFERTGDSAVLAEAVQAFRDAVAATPAGHPDRAGYLFSLGAALQVMFERTGEPAVLAEAIGPFRAAVAATPAGHPDRARYLNNLGNAVRMLFERTGDSSVLPEAVQAGRDAVAATPAGHPDRAAVLCNLGAALQVLSARTGDTTMLAEAVQACRDAVAATPAGHPDRAIVLNSLGNALQVLSGRTVDSPVLAEAVQAARDAVAATPAGHPDRAGYLSSLGAALQVLAVRTVDSAVLAEAVQACRDAVAATAAGDPDRAGYLSNLGAALQVLAVRTGDSAVLAEAVQAGRDAVAATPAGHSDSARYLTNLGNTLQKLSERTGDSAVLAEAVQAGRDAVAATPAGHPDRAAVLNNLGNALQKLSERTGDGAVLAEAVQAGRDAVAATSTDHPDYAGQMNNLGNTLRALSVRTGDSAVLAEAVQAGRDAVAATPADSPDLAAVLANIGGALRVLSERTGDSATLAEAVQAGRDAVAATPIDHPDYAGRLFNLGTVLRLLSGRPGQAAVLVEAGGCFRAAAENASAPAAVRISAYRAVAGLPGRAGGSPEGALAAVEAAVGLLPQVAPRALARADREHSLGQLASLAGQAAAAAVTARRPGRAVELLEQTRGVLVADTLDARSSDLTRLRGHSPGLADEFDELRSRIDALDYPGAFAFQAADTGGGEPDPAQARRDAHAAWPVLIARIRAVGGFENFLDPPGIRQLALQAQDGPVVFIYTSPSRCDALIVTGDPRSPVRLVPLADLTEEDAYRQANRLLNARRVAGDPRADPIVRIAAQPEILDVLAWMWDTLTGPVLAALGLVTTPADGQPSPRVWWCPVGILAYLPLHAAGHHHDLTAGHANDQPQPRTVLDRVVSSYTTTVRGLAYARAQHPDPAADTTLIIAVPDAPGASPLPGAAAEASALEDLIPGARLLPRPTRDSVLAALPGHTVAHFACHGYADWANPAASQLILYDHATTPLTVADVSARHLTGGLAYLSACDTGVTSPALANEAVHITGAFQLAGYQNVIGTLWPVSDTAARDLACDFYSQLTRHGTTPPDTSRAAHALHNATRRLRGEYPPNPTFWAAHTHTGT